MTYQLLPSGEQFCESAFWDNGFSVDDINRIREMGDAQVLTTGTINRDSAIDEDVRRAQVAFLGLADSRMWLFDKLGFIARQLNAQYFQLDLVGFAEDLQYTVYNDSGHYQWHMDKGPSSPAPRKLSLVLQLSDPDEYEGGELQLMIGPDPQVVPRQMGLLYAFPSYVVHKVTPVTRGTRRSLVVWLCGPKFR